MGEGYVNKGQLKSVLPEEEIQKAVNGNTIFCTFRSILSDLKRAVKVWPDDLELHLVLETLQLSQDALLVNPAELAGQLVGRIHGTNSSTLITQAKDMLSQGKLPAEALPILNLLESFEIRNQEKTKVGVMNICCNLNIKTMV